MNKKLDNIIKNCNKLIDMPYNQLNLDNYEKKIKEAYNMAIDFVGSDKNAPIKLMSGQHPKAGRITFITVPILGAVSTAKKIIEEQFLVKIFLFDFLNLESKKIP